MLEENKALRGILLGQYGVKSENVTEIIEHAREQTLNRGAIDNITRFISASCSYDDRMQLSKNLWSVANADGRLKQEEIDFISGICNHLGLLKDDIEDTKSSSHLKLLF